VRLEDGAAAIIDDADEDEDSADSMPQLVLDDERLGVAEDRHGGIEYDGVIRGRRFPLHGIVIVGRNERGELNVSTPPGRSFRSYAAARQKISELAAAVKRDHFALYVNVSLRAVERPNVATVPSARVVN
jgi:hypothetical protein